MNVSPAAAPSVTDPTSQAPWQRRAAEIVRIASEYRTGIRVRDLIALLPATAPSDPDDIARWFSGQFPEGTIVDGVVYGNAIGATSLPERATRAERYLASARQLMENGLGSEREWVRCAAVTGSVSYGEAREGDDCDLLVVTRPHAVWPFLLLAFLRFRFRRDSAQPPWCLNLVADEDRAAEEFLTPQGFHVAREALLARVVHGAAYYDSLLRRSPWMRDEIPRLYAERVSGEETGAPIPLEAPRLVRAANLPIFLALGAYVAAMGLVRNARLRRSGRAEKCFRTRLSPHGLTYDSLEFDLLRGAYDRAPMARD
jgi:hypothetical protein